MEQTDTQMDIATTILNWHWADSLKKTSTFVCILIYQRNTNQDLAGYILTALSKGSPTAIL